MAVIVMGFSTKDNIWHEFLKTRFRTASPELLVHQKQLRPATTTPRKSLGRIPIPKERP
jgi:hypothetical protein